MKTSQTGRQLIESFEGLILGAYDDFNDRIVKPGEAIRGTLTIGYGHTNAAGPPKVTVGQRLTKEQADQILESDLSSVEVDVTHLVKVPLNQNQFDALVSFQFNTGALGKSSALRYLNNGDYARCADALLLYNRGNGQVLQGLVTRRKAERDLFLRKPPVVAPIAGGIVVTALAAAYDYKLAIALGVACLIGLGIYIYNRNKKD